MSAADTRPTGTTGQLRLTLEKIHDLEASIHSLDAPSAYPGSGPQQSDVCKQLLSNCDDYRKELEWRIGSNEAISHHKMKGNSRMPMHSGPEID